MAIAQGNCPNCGAPIEFAVGSSLAKVCEFCRHTVLRSDRGLENLGKIADLALTASLIAVGDEGTLSGRPFRVLGRVQLDHGTGPWDEYYVAFDHGAAWGYLAYAEGQWFTTSPVPGISAPDVRELYLERDVLLGQAGTLRVVELKTATVVSAEGEQPQAPRPGSRRVYADLWGQNQAFGTLDYGDGSELPSVFLGWAFPETALVVSALGPRSAHKVKVTALKCPNCGGDVPALLPDRSERLGCPYCGAVSDIAGRNVIAQQMAARAAPVIPIGARGNFEGVEYICLAMLRRGSNFEGELYEWEEFLLFSQKIGFRWLVLDPERGWSWVKPVNVAELDLTNMPRSVGYRGRTFQSQNSNTARVTYVLGEVYWKCEIGETTEVRDFADGSTTLSREASPSEVRWSQGDTLSYADVAKAFDLPLTRTRTTPHASQSSKWLVWLVVIVIVLCIIVAFSSLDGTTTTTSGSWGGGVYRGGGSYSGGK